MVAYTCNLRAQGSQEDCKFKANFSYIEGTGQRKRTWQAGKVVHSVRVLIAERFDLNSIPWNPQVEGDLHVYMHVCPHIHSHSGGVFFFF